MAMKTRRAPIKAPKSASPIFLAFDAGKNQRRLRSMPQTSTAINTQVKRFGRTVIARSRYLCLNNPYASQAKEEFVSALVGSGIKPSWLTEDAKLKQELQELWLEWTDEADADGLTDFYGLQELAAGEMFEAGECFIRLRPRFESDGLSVPLQLQLLPSEMLAHEHNEDRGNGSRIECGIEFDSIGRRTAYHFWRVHPGTDLLAQDASRKTVVPADQVLHLFKPIVAGQIRGIPHTLSGIVTAAVLDCYEDAELERKRTAALFAAFVTRNSLGDDDHPLEIATADGGIPPTSSGPAPMGDFNLEPGAVVDLEDGEDIKFSEPADVGANFEAFSYRALLRMAAGYGVPYAAMTGDLRQTSYGSIRAGLVAFRRRIEKMQNSVMIFQFCRPIRQRWLADAALSGALTVSPAQFRERRRELLRVKWITPKWEWIDPLKDLQAEKLAVDNGFKARSDVIEASGYDPEETDGRIKSDQDRKGRLDLKFGEQGKAPAVPAPDETAPSVRALNMVAEAMRMQAERPPVALHMPEVKVIVPEIKIPDIVAEVRIPKQPAPIVNVAAPIVNVASPTRKILSNVKHDARGRIIQATVEES